MNSILQGSWQRWTYWSARSPRRSTYNHAAAAEPSDAEIRKIASLVLTQAVMGVENITHDSANVAADRVEVDLEQVYRAKDRLYIRYSVANRSKHPSGDHPDVSAPSRPSSRSRS